VTWTSRWNDGSRARRRTVQLSGGSATSLVARGQADLETWALRAVVHGHDLLAVSDDEVRPFGISDRDQPSEAANLVY